MPCLPPSEHADRAGGQPPAIAPPDQLEGHVGNMTLPGMQLHAHPVGDVGERRTQRRTARMTADPMRGGTDVRVNVDVAAVTTSSTDAAADEPAATGPRHGQVQPFCHPRCCN